MTQSPFNAEHDPELGALLREQLGGPAPEQFLRRLRAAVVAAPRADQWDVLDAWSRPRVMALAIAAGLLLWLGAWFENGQPAVDPGVMVASLPTHAVVSSQTPAVDEIMAALRDRP
ncbi:MAG TPA: hypothetical protein VL241_01230 [Gemmatimonadales bacterium]|nr:hypothetical protein [Gemmatimonadales bacterium]